MPNEQLGYAGVFLTNPDLDTVFADSEPPTHDNWVPKSLSNRRYKIFVNVAMRNIEREMETFAKPPAVGGAAHLTPLGEFANSLGSSLIPSIQGPAATFLPGSSSGSPRSAPSGGTGITANRANIRILSEGEFVIVNNTPALQVQFAVAHAQDSAGTVVTVYASAVLDGAQPETDPPVGGSQPQVLCWTAPDETEYPGSESLFIPSQSQESWLVAVSVPEDMMLRVDMQAEPQALQ
jgi:hypothetical protein